MTRWLTVGITAMQAPGYIVNLRSQVPGAIISVTNPEIVSPFTFWFTSIVILTAGTLFVMWLGENITDKGIGNGISLIIMMGILARLPHSFRDEVLLPCKLRVEDWLLFFIELVALGSRDRSHNFARSGYTTNSGQLC